MTKWNVPDDEPKGDKKDLHPEGLYDAVIIASKTDKTKNGKDMIRLEFKTGQGKVHGRLVHSPESPKASWAFFQQLANMGVDREYLEKEPDIDDIAAECVKARVMIRVAHREYQGDVFADIEWIDGAPVSALPSVG